MKLTKAALTGPSSAATHKSKINEVNKVQILWN